MKVCCLKVENILQAQIMKEYPNELTVIFFYNLCVSIVAGIVGLITETNPNAWKLRPDIALLSVVCSVRNYQPFGMKPCKFHTVYSCESEFSLCLGNLWIILEQYCPRMGFALERSCICSNVQASIHCNCCCHGGLVPW